MFIKEKEPFKINLQLFGSPFNSPEFQAQAAAFDPSQGGQGGNGQAAPQEQPQGDNPQNSPQAQENGGQPNPDARQTEGQTEPGQQPNQPGQEQPGQQAPQDGQGLILGKFKSPEEVLNAYQQLESFNTQTRQELAAQKQTTEQLVAALEQMKQQNQASMQQPEQVNQANPDQENEQMLNSLMENPVAFFNELKQQAKQEALQEIAPIRQQYQAQQQQQAFNQAMTQFAQQTPDIEAFKPAMSDILAQNPELNGHPGGPMAALNIAYNMAKGQQYQPPEAILQNRDAVLQSITPEEKQQFINEYLQNVSKNNATPVTIGNQVGGNIPITPENKPKSLAEASEMALRMFQGQ